MVQENSPMHKSCLMLQFSFLVSPRILSPLQDIIIQVGKRLELTCNTSADPAAVISWTKDNLQLPSSAKLGMHNSTLIIESTVIDDDGEYTCFAKNRQGNTSSSATVEVQGTWRFCLVPVYFQTILGNSNFNDFSKILQNFLFCLHNQLNVVKHGKTWQSCGIFYNVCTRSILIGRKETSNQSFEFSLN